MRVLYAVALLLFLAMALGAQTTAASVGKVLESPLQNPDVTAWQIRRYVVERVPKLKVPKSAEQWTAESKRLRQRALETAFHGWPAQWVAAPPVFHDLGEIYAGKGYRLRKLRYEIVPGFESTALLYEPETRTGKLPAILDVNGHEAEGKAMEYVQKRCIEQARHGILALNLEWIGMGELSAPGNAHWNNAYLDLAGANGLGLFYLAMRKGLDYLWERQDVDRTRLGITGLSGGGWQSIVLGALDERVFAALPDAGYRSVLSVGGAEMIGDNEQSATDLNAGFDYIYMTALRAPRPTMLIYNETDNCCFRAPLMKPSLYDSVRPFFALYHALDDFHWYENTDPGDHNYQLDNRLHSYGFFAKYFHLPRSTDEASFSEDLRTSEQLTVGLPNGNLTILELASQFAKNIKREPVPAEGRGRQQILLKNILRYRPVNLDAAWAVANSWGSGMKTVGYRFDFNDGLSATGALMRSVDVPDKAPWSIVLNDAGKKASGAAVSARVNRGELVLAADLLFTGDAAPPPHYFPVYDRMLATEGSRSLGIEVSQLIEITNWLIAISGNPAGHLEASGIRSQAAALIAAALKPEAYEAVGIHDGLNSWREVFSRPVRYQDAPELFCLDLYRWFDLSDIRAMTK